MCFSRYNGPGRTRPNRRRRRWSAARAVRLPLRFAVLGVFLLGSALSAAQIQSDFGQGNACRFEVDQVLAQAATVPSAIGDINGDGIDDRVATFTFAGADGMRAAVVHRVVFGRKPGLSPARPDSNTEAAEGFRLDLGAGEDGAGVVVSAAGDVNGDGIDDLLVGNPAASPGARPHAGSVYVVFGRRSAFPATLSVSRLDGQEGFRLDGEMAGEGFGTSLSAVGDMNGDGIDDILIGAGEGPVEGSHATPRKYVIFGRTSGFPATFVLSRLNGRNGFRFDDIGTTDRIASRSGFAKSPQRIDDRSRFRDEIAKQSLQP